MLTAVLFPEPHQGKKATSSKIEEVHSGAVSQARTIVKEAPDLVTCGS
jgi:hypothetical protein